MSALADLSTQLSGLALNLHQADSGEVLDLAGVSSEAASSAISAALAQPFDEIRRITLIVSGGKQVRGKYHLDLFKESSAALKAAGYKSEMEGGDESKGNTWKSQHDTGKNLKTIVIFTKCSAAEANSTSLELESVIGGPLDSSTSDSKVAMCSVPLFRKLVETKAPSWSEKKSLLSSLQGSKALYDDLMAGMLRGSVATEQEQGFLDGVDSLDEKMTSVRSQVREMG